MNTSSYICRQTKLSLCEVEVTGRISSAEEYFICVVINQCGSQDTEAQTEISLSVGDTQAHKSQRQTQTRPKKDRSDVHATHIRLFIGKHTEEWLPRTLAPFHLVPFL